MKKITIFTDGASRGNPGPSGWGVIIFGDMAIELGGHSALATNNQMELQAVIEALTYIRQHNIAGDIVLHADSAYVLNGLSSWVSGWIKNNWITSTKKPVENKVQWQTLWELKEFFSHRLHLQKVKGHSGDTYNDRCDDIAVSFALKKPITLFSGSALAYEQYLKDHTPQSLDKSRSKQKGDAYSYVALVDGNVLVFKTWDECKQKVTGKKGALYKKVFSKQEETEIIQDFTLKTLL